MQALDLHFISMVVNFPNINLRIPGADFSPSCTSIEEHFLPSQRNQNSGLHLPVFWTAQSLFGFTNPIWIISFFAIDPETTPHLSAIVAVFTFSLSKSHALCAEDYLVNCFCRLKYDFLLTHYNSKCSPGLTSQNHLMT